MPNRDQLEVIKASGEIAFYDLDPGQGVINIGRDLENDIVIESPGVAPFHAVLIHGQKPYHLMALSQVALTILGGEPLPPNVSREVHPWDTIEIDGHTLILLEGEAAPARPARVSPPAPAAVVRPAPAGAASLPTPAPAIKAPPTPVPIVSRRPVGSFPVRPPDQPDDMIVTELSEREWTIDVDQTATLQVTVANGGPHVAAFEVSVEGLDPDWVIIFPAQINLNEAGAEGSRGTVSVAITPPRQPSSQAGDHHFAVVVTSPTYAGRRVQRGATLTINPYYEYAVRDLDPKRQAVYYSRPTGQTKLKILNKGNSNVLFRIEGFDDEHACAYEFPVPGEKTKQASHTEMRLAPEEMAVVPVDITPRRRRLVGLRSAQYRFTIVSTLLEGAQAPHEKLGELIGRPLLGPWHLALLAICLALLVVAIFQPNIKAFTADSRMVRAGEQVTLRWNASPFVSLRMEPGAEQVGGPTGEKVVTPEDTITYQLNADNLLSQLFPRLFERGSKKEVTVHVTPIKPTIRRFDAERTSILNSETAKIFWEVENASELILETNGAPETLSEPVGQRPDPLTSDTTYVLRARNRYGEVSDSLEVKVINPTPTPLPTPALLLFDVLPSEITAGENVTINWQVSGVNTVSLAPLSGKFPPFGSMTDSPSKTTNYNLEAENDEGKTVSQVRTVKVNPAPTATPKPEAPKIDVFEVTPAEVEEGEGAQLTWTVSGDTTNIEITGPDFPTISGLQKQGSLDVAGEKTTLFVLTAYNGDLSTSATAQLKVKPPPTATPTPIPKPIIVSFKADGEKAGDVQFKGGDPPKYEVVAGSKAVLSWEVKDADKVELIGFGNQAPKDEITLPPVVREATYQLKAENAGGPVDAFLKLELSPQKPPPAPYNVSGEVAAPTITITWSYDPDYKDAIKGFRVYRADTLLADESNLDSDASSYPDTPPSTCGQIYYVAAVYYDIVDDRLKEVPSVSSWVSLPCNP